MSLPNATGRFRDRAKIVCVHCHSRKVRCDLQEQETGNCSNCRRRGQHCRRHSGVGRKRISPSSPASQASNSAGSTREPPHINVPSADQTQAALPQALTWMPSQPGFIGEHSLMSPSIYTTVVPQIGSFPQQVHDEILKLTGATSLPPISTVQVYTDAYFKHLYHRAPVIDRKDLQVKEPSILLLQAVCLIGSLLRYPKDRNPIAVSEPYYLKIKTLFYATHEADKLVTLKALCALCFWNMTPPVMVNLDSAWQWLGMAVRLAYQMGLHRESSYAKIPNSGVVRRIMWFLFVEDKIQAAAFGRPAMLEMRNFDLRPLKLDDFEYPDTSSELFMEYVKLSMLLGHIVEYQDRKTQIPFEHASYILHSLEQWINNLPSKLRLYDQTGCRIYRRDIYEVHIHYFAYLIASTASLVASSCLARLYQEIDDHDEINYLMPVHNWHLMVSCVPQIHHETVFQEEDDLCNTELNTFSMALRCMRLKWPPANNILATVDRLCATKADKIFISGEDARQGAPSGCQQPMDHHFAASELKGLFPFPPDMCRRMELVDQGFEEDRDGAASVAPSSTLGVMDWIFDEFHQDLLDMPFVG